VHNVHWIEQFCVLPFGPDKGQRVKLTPAERTTVLWIYDAPNGPADDVNVDGALGSYFALLHTVGIEATRCEIRPTINVDTFMVWNACSENLLAYLERKGERVVCLGLGTVYPPVAA
jgi:hypothetical protein